MNISIEAGFFSIQKTPCDHPMDTSWFVTQGGNGKDLCDVYLIDNRMAFYMLANSLPNKEGDRFVSYLNKLWQDLPVYSTIEVCHEFKDSKLQLQFVVTEEEGPTFESGDYLDESDNHF